VQQLALAFLFWFGLLSTLFADCSLGIWRAALGEEIAGFPGEFRNHQIVGFAQQFAQFVDGERVAVF